MERAHHPMFPLPSASPPWRKIEGNFVSTSDFEGQSLLKVDLGALTALADEAMHDLAHFLRPGHLQQLRDILDDDEASANDQFVALDLLQNSCISSGGVLPLCQDTGTAVVMAWKGDRVWTGGDDANALARGIQKTWEKDNLRHSQLAPSSMFAESNTGSNLPAQIDLWHCNGNSMDFLFLAKGGGSANKTFLHQANPSLLREDLLLAFLEKKIADLGTAACPPYHLAIVVGGTSADQNLKTVKLASARYLDELPTEGADHGHAIRCPDLEEKILEITRQSGTGAQFGGKYFCHDVRVIRLPRHGASLPIGIGVSCSADRQIWGRIDADGVFLEQLETDPARFLPDVDAAQLLEDPVKLDLGAGMEAILAELRQHPVRTRLSLNGPMIVARDLAHAKLRELLDQGKSLPDWFLQYPIYYAGPAKKPDGLPSGSFGPTTAGRMDGFVEQFQAAGGSMVMVAKGNRSATVARSCQKHGGFYLGSVGGSAARLAKDCIRSVECVAFEEMGMEAIWKIEVEDFPAFIITDDQGNDFFLGSVAGEPPTESEEV